jgi:hypothetical protein
LKFHQFKDHVMKRILLSLAFAATLIVGSLATPSTADAQRRWRSGYYGGGYYGGYYRPYYGAGYYRPYYGGYYSPYRSYYRGYGYGYPGYYNRGYYNRGYGYPGGYYYNSPGVRIGAGVGGVGAGIRLF